MKRFILLAIYFSIGRITFGQTDKLEYILSLKADTLKKVDQSQKENVFFLQTEFGSSKFVKLPNPDILQNNIILKVELIYTLYSLSESFDQEELNRKRIISLNEIAPQILKNEMIDWKLIGQTGCTSSAQGNTFFHGFIITYRPLPTKESVEKEIAYLDKILSDDVQAPDLNENLPKTTKRKGKSFRPKQSFITAHIFYTKGKRRKPEELPAFVGGEKALLDHLSKSIKPPKKPLKKGVQGLIFITFTIDKKGLVKPVPSFSTKYRSRKAEDFFAKEALRVILEMPEWIPGKIKGKPVSSDFTIPFRFTSEGMVPLSPAVYYSGMKSDTTGTAKFISGYITNQLNDSSLADRTVFNILKRNPGWNKMLAVCDLTGSMAPYNAQLLFWYKLKVNPDNQKVAFFSFFNDGDAKPDKDKEIGKTGGIYHTQAKDFDAVKSLAIKTMKRGFGGDTPENNIEALLAGIEKCKDCNDIIMIADNYATPRDLSLLSEVTKPVKIILCGTEGGINTDYLDMARKTKSSIHTIEEDLTNLMDLNEGESIKIGKKKYIIKNGSFEPAYKR